VRRRLLLYGTLIAGVGALIYGGYWWRYAATHVWTDDAYVEGAIAVASSKVPGRITKLHVRDNQPVREGDVLAEIDPRDYQAKADQARAAMAGALADQRAARSEVPLARKTTRTQIDHARAALGSALVAVRSSQSAVLEARARVESKRATMAALKADVTAAQSILRKAKLELDRMRRLVKDGFVSRREFEQAESAFETSEAGLEAAQRRRAQAELEVSQSEAELQSRILAVEQAKQRVMEARAMLARAEGQVHQVAIKEAETSRASARLEAAQADLTYALLQLENAAIKAPVTGVVSKKSVEVGQMVQPGQPLLAVVPLHDVWVVANFKETQLTRVRPRMKAAVSVDGYPGVTFTGTVESISAGTGSRFSLLPPENATGNWVKVVQRVPVKILLDSREYGNPHTLRTGMSAVVTIRVK
jgi:membrane fusion protein (multidrug efflux system)